MRRSLFTGLTIVFFGLASVLAAAPAQGAFSGGAGAWASATGDLPTTIVRGEYVRAPITVSVPAAYAPCSFVAVLRARTSAGTTSVVRLTGTIPAGSRTLRLTGTLTPALVQSSLSTSGRLWWSVTVTSLARRPNVTETFATVPVAYKVVAPTSRQGVCGKVLKLKGNFMPGPGAVQGVKTPLSVPVHVFKGKVKPFETPDPKHPQLVATTRSAADGTYRIGLEPGIYTVVAEIDGKLYLGPTQDDGSWATVTVQRDKWTAWNIEDTSEAAF